MGLSGGEIHLARDAMNSERGCNLDPESDSDWCSALCTFDASRPVQTCKLLIIKPS